MCLESISFRTSVEVKMNITKLNKIGMKKMWMVSSPPPPHRQINYHDYLSCFILENFLNFVTIYTNKLIATGGLSSISVVLKELGYEENLQKFQVVFIHLQTSYPKQFAKTFKKNLWCLMKYSNIYLKHSCINTILKVNKLN